MKKMAFVLVALLVFTLSGCMKSEIANEDYVLNEEVYGNSAELSEDPSYFPEESSGGNIADFSDNPVLANRKIIYIADLAMLVEDPVVAYEAILSKLITYEAYVEEEKITESKYELTIRVLSTNLIDFINDIKESGELVSYEKTSEDITNSYSTFEARRDALETQHARILELIVVAEDLDEILILDAARFDIETELNEIGYQLATYDALVDYSTINLVMVKTEDVIILLDRTEKPYLQVVDYDSDSISVKVFNTSENSVTMYLDVKDNGVVVETFSQDAYGISYLEFELTDLDPATSYTFEIYAIEDDHSVSLSNLSTITTNKTYFLKVTDVFTVSLSSLSSVASFLGLALTALAPFAVVGGLLFVPARIIYVKKIKPNKSPIVPKE